MYTIDKYWCAFSRLTKVGSAFTISLFNYFGSIELAWNAQFCDLLNIPDITRKQISDFLDEKKQINPEQSFNLIKERGIDFIHFQDERYPVSLKFIDNPPSGLFMLGDISNCNLDKALAVVGSRRASENAKNVLSNILSEFKNTDVCIISGLAEGIDTVAHKSAVNNNIKTIAVIGGGFDKLYPKSNISLFNDIIHGNGAVLTEYWLDENAISWHFPVRNRIVSGLSRGVLVAEAALKSGAMITANLALEQGKELMCMPGLISNPNTQGIYKLLKNGASMVTCAQDILDTMNWYIPGINKQNTSDISLYSDDEKLIIDILKKDSLSFDELIIKTGFNIDDLMIILTKLELDGIIFQTNGEKYTC